MMENLQENNGNNSNVINNQVQGDGNTIYNNTAGSPVPTRTKQEPLLIFGKQVKTKAISIAGVTAFLASIATIYTSFKSLFEGTLIDKDYTTSPFISYLPIILVIIMMLALYLIQVFRSSALIVGKHKIASHQGKLYFEEYEATCPNCGSKLKTVSFKGASYLRCKLYSEHVFRFNPKLFDEASYK